MGLWPTRGDELPLVILTSGHAMACPYNGQRGCDFQESPDLIGATKDLHSSLKLRLRGFPDFWGPMVRSQSDRKSDFASLRMTGCKGFSEDPKAPALPCAESKPRSVAGYPGYALRSRDRNAASSCGRRN